MLAQGVNTVVIDAGHGGRDPGNLGTGRYKEREKDIALVVSLQLGKYINEAYPDVKVIYTRNNDVFIPLHKRTEIANNAHADLFISIHCNSAANTSVYGTETYVMGFKYSSNNLALTKKENAVIFMEDDYEQNYDGMDPNNPESSIIASLYQNAFLDQSINFADFVEHQFAERVGRKSRGVKQSVLFVMNRTTMPSALIELGFLTNKTEEDFLISEDGKTYMASAIFRAFKNYKATVEGIQDYLESKKTNNKASVVQKPNDAKLVYKIQVAASANPFSKRERRSDRGELEEMQIDGKYKYFFSSHSSYALAKEDLDAAHKSGFKSAFVVALKNGKPIALSEALKN